MKTTKLAYLVPRFPDMTHAFFWREVRAMRDMGIDVSLVSTRPPSEASGEGGEDPFVREARAETYYLGRGVVRSMAWLALHPLRTWKATRYVAGLKESGRKEKGRILALLPAAANLCRFAKRRGIDRVHIHSCANSAHVGGLARRLGGVDYSLTLHGDLPVYGKDHSTKMAEASFVSVVTRPLREQVLGATGRTERTVPVITMGVDTDRFYPSPQAGAEKRPLEIITVSRLILQKGHADALAGLARLAEEGLSFRYTIVGEGPEREAIEADVRCLGLEGRVRFVGRLGEDEVREKLQESDVFLLPSYGLGEAAPVSVMEAMACGLVVICSRIGGTPDMIRDGVDGYLIPQRDSIALASAIRGVSHDTDRRRRIARAARRSAVARFDYRRTAEALAGYLTRTPETLAAA